MLKFKNWSDLSGPDQDMIAFLIFVTSMIIWLVVFCWLFFVHPLLWFLWLFLPLTAAVIIKFVVWSDD